MEKMTQHQLGQIKQKLSKLSQKFELVAAGFILRFTRNLKIAPTIILPSLLITHPCYAGNVEKREVLKIKRNVDFTLFSKYNYSEKEKRK